MLVSTASLDKTFVQLCLPTCTSLLSMRGGPITAQFTAAQTTEPWSSKDRRQHCTAQVRVGISSVQLLSQFHQPKSRGFYWDGFPVRVNSYCPFGCQISSRESKSINSKTEVHLVPTYKWYIFTLVQSDQWTQWLYFNSQISLLSYKSNSSG